MDDKDKNTIRIAQKLDKKLEKIGFKRENRRYNPHLTLGRVKTLIEKEAFTQFILDNSALFLGTMKIDRVFLFRSQLKPDGAVYTKLKEFLL
ncbi:MAG: 2'-5' RNA ligase family protein [Thermodesulfobacteriota bacterium]|nr:2'-5' RNA ligase family protein [Thermodesulfobacteriota bacterium]